VGLPNGQVSGELADCQRIGGGSADYDGRELKRAHAGTGTSRQFAKIMSDLIEALADTENVVVSAGAS
jgi:hypothetical protein